MSGFVILLLETVYPNAPAVFTLPSYIKYIFTLALGLAGLMAFAALVRGGFLYLTSAGNVDKMKEAKEPTTSGFFATKFSTLSIKALPRNFLNGSFTTL